MKNLSSFIKKAAAPVAKAAPVLPAKPAPAPVAKPAPAPVAKAAPAKAGLGNAVSSMVKKAGYKEGGAIFRSSANGIAQRGKTKATQVKMCGGGMAKKK